MHLTFLTEIYPNKMMYLRVGMGILDEIGTFLLYIGCRVEKYLSNEFFERSKHGTSWLDPYRGQILSKIEIDIIVTN